MPRNEWERHLRTKTALEQASRTTASKGEEEKSRHHPRVANAMAGVYVPNAHDEGERWSMNKSGKRTRVLRANIKGKAAKHERESLSKVDPGDTRARSKLGKKMTRDDVLN